jgi:hypothetical protein
MKNKKSTYLLAAAVLIVWGLILYRVFGAMGDNEPDEPSISAPLKKEAYNDYAIPRDTTHLLLNYRDPFGMVAAKDTTSHKHNPAGPAQAAQHIAAPAMNWDFIRYVGYIRNPDSKKLVAMVHLNGTELMMSEGESNGSLKLIKNLRDSIRVNYQGKTKYIPLKPANP